MLRNVTTSVKRMTIIATIALVALGATGVGTLVAISAELNSLAEGITHSMESVRLGGELQSSLLLHERSADPLVRARLVNRTHRLANQLEQHATTPAEQRMLPEVKRTLEGYLDGAEPGRADPTVVDAFSALDELVDVNVREARALLARSGRWDVWADALGMAGAALLVLGAALIIFWLRTSVMRPVLRLRESIERFGNGDRATRAPLTGPIELREIAARFNGMAEALARKRREEMAFLGSVAHDIRDPLSAIRYVSMSLAEEKRGRDPSLERPLAAISRQLERIEHLVGELLDAAQLEAGHLQLHRAPCDLAQIARDVGERFASSAATHQLVLDLPEYPVLMTADGPRLHQALTNLVSNAIKYSPEGSPVRIALRARSDHIELSVSDMGYGIPPREQSFIFEPFRRATGAERMSPGTGLGLFITERIVHAHGGRIELESEVGKGSIFRIILRDRTVVVAASAAEPAPAASETVDLTRPERE